MRLVCINTIAVNFIESVSFMQGISLICEDASFLHQHDRCQFHRIIIIGQGIVHMAAQQRPMIADVSVVVTDRSLTG